MLANLWGKKSDGKPFELSDFILKFISEGDVANAFADVSEHDRSDHESRESDESQQTSIDGHYGIGTDADEVAAAEKARQMALLVIELNKALGGEDKRTPEQKARLREAAR